MENERENHRDHRIQISTNDSFFFSIKIIDIVPEPIDVYYAL